MPNSPDTDAALTVALAEWQRAGANDGGFQHTLKLPRPWRAAPDELVLQAHYRFRREAGLTRLSAVVDGQRIPLDEPVRLVPTDIPKPWGREIWYTGIEARGESRVCTATGNLPLSQYLALAPEHLRRRAPLTLLKVLDPRPEPVVGDLYFELHEEKREVYVVTHVDAAAWPTGTGGIRFGMNQALRRQYDDDAAFRAAYLRAVRAYESVRRAIDDAENRPGTADQALAAREALLRADMERFTETHPLQVGDVVVVPTWVPHSLQHGVRVVEFQTPTYERRIISFAQKVLTQNHWDSEPAIMGMRLDTPPTPRFEDIPGGFQQLVTFEDFSVWRAHLPTGATKTLPDHPSYLLCMALAGTVQVGELLLEPEQAAFIPGWLLQDADRQRATMVRNPGADDASFLIAAPDL